MHLVHLTTSTLVFRTFADRKWQSYEARLQSKNRELLVRDPQHWYTAQYARSGELHCSTDRKIGNALLTGETECVIQATRMMVVAFRTSGSKIIIITH